MNRAVRLKVGLLLVLALCALPRTGQSAEDTQVRLTYVPNWAPNVSELAETRDKLPPDCRPLAMHF